MLVVFYKLPLAGNMLAGLFVSVQYVPVLMPALAVHALAYNGPASRVSTVCDNEDVIGFVP